MSTLGAGLTLSGADGYWGMRDDPWKLQLAEQFDPLGFKLFGAEESLLLQT